MRVVIQRISSSSVEIKGIKHAEIGQGLLLFLGIEEMDSQQDLDWLIPKILQLRIFSDTEGNMNLSIQEIQGEILIISQFTLFASTKKGNRPGFSKAANPKKAVELYNLFIDQIKLAYNGKIESGIFGSDMKIYLINDGPVTIIIDTKDKV
ncbi:MAG: D-tyrosyl-tRNA(Tyr) deacylase [Saprospiraceae bacterium]|nr:D-tyrosyl-tRNA(Tyr) deacylase [Saprospiraceae bacterium]